MRFITTELFRNVPQFVTQTNTVFLQTVGCVRIIFCGNRRDGMAQMLSTELKLYLTQNQERKNGEHMHRRECLAAISPLK